MKKIIALIVIVCSVSIGLFVYFMTSGVDTRDVYYDSIVTYQNVTYKNLGNESLKMDIIMPTTDVFDEIPVVFYVHGGDFTSGDKSDLTEGVRRYIVEDLLDEGYAIITLNYRLIDETSTFPDNLADVNDAIKYTTSLAEGYNFDVDNYGIWGVEAGAFLALTVAYSENGYFGGDSTLTQFSADIKYVLDFSGITNFLDLTETSGLELNELDENQARLNLLFGDRYNIYELSNDDINSINHYVPLTYISNDTIPTYIIHGENDDLVDISHSILLKDELEDYSVTLTYRAQAGGDANLSGLHEAERNIIVDEVIAFVKQNYIEN